VVGQLSSKGIGSNGILTGPGISAEIPIFNRNQGLIARADADVEVARLQYLNLKQRVAFEVYEARELLQQALEQLAQLKGEVLPQLQRSATLAEQQYEKGDVAYLFVLEQSRGLVDAELRLADAEAAVSRAEAQLERSVGTKW
jgi:cobalt-zinc-cadmium efflux system outer membrane protein